MIPLLSTDPVTIGPATLVGRLGSGGMSTVYLARLGDAEVALKVIAPELAADSDYRRRLGREVEMLARVRSPRLASLVAADPEGAPPWLAMTYIEGATLFEEVRVRGILAADRVNALAQELAEGLEALHGGGVVHRDITPLNVIVSPAGAVLVDLGIARLGGGVPLTRTGVVVGTPGWMSPEQITGGEVGPATDVFSWGGVIVFAATGRAPFGAGDPAALGYRIAHTDPDLDGLPSSLRTIAAAALRRAPAERPSATDLRAALTGGRTLVAPPAPRTAVAGVAAPPPAAATRVARNRATSTPSVPAPSARSGPYWPWWVLAGVCALSVLVALLLLFLP